MSENALSNEKSDTIPSISSSVKTNGNSVTGEKKGKKKKERQKEENIVWGAEHEKILVEWY